MATRLHGILLDGLNNPIINATVALIAKGNTITVLNGSEAIFRTDGEGAYNVTVQTGHYKVIIGPQGVEPYKAGEIVIYGDSPEGSLNGYLINWAPEELTPDVIKQVQQLVANSEEYALQAGRSAAAANADATDARNSKATAATSASEALTYKNDSKTNADAAKQAQAGAAGSANTATQAVTTIQGLKADVEQLKGETTALKDAAAASATQASNSATEAGQQASNAAGSAQSASTDAGRAEVAAGKAEQVIRKALLKENNLSDLPDKNSARGQLNIDLHVQDGNYTFVYSRNKLYRLVVGSDGVCQFQKAEGQLWVILPLPVIAGGTGSTTSEGARNNLELGVHNSPQFKDIHLYDENTLTSGMLWCTLPKGRTRLYHQVEDGTHKTILETYNEETNNTKQLKYDEQGHLSGVLLLNAGEISAETVTTETMNCTDTLYGNVIDATGTILSRAGVYSIGGKPVGVQTPQGAGGNHSIHISTSTSVGDAPVDSWVNYLQGYYYNGNYTFGAIRGGATQIQSVRLFIDSGEGYNSTFEFKTLPANNGYIRSERGFNGRSRPIGWLDTHHEDAVPFYAKTLENNDLYWMPIVTGASMSTGGYELRTALGVSSAGNNAWPNAVIQLLGDKVVQRVYNFSAMNGDISTTTGGDSAGKGWNGNYIFQKAASSDRDLKYDIVYTDGKESYDRVMRWLPTLFKYTGSDIQRYGLIAQDLLKVDPEYVKLVPGGPILEPVVQMNNEGEEVTQYIETGRKDDTLALDNNVILTDLACAFRYQADKVNKLEQELTELKKLVHKLVNPDNLP